MRKLVSAVALLSLMAGAANAGSTSANLSVSMSVTANCSISTAVVAFGAYDPTVANLTTALNGSGSVSVSCTTGDAWTITLGQGANAATGSTDLAPLRRMSDGASHFASYALYQDTTRLVPWNNTSLTGKTGTGTGANQTISVYGTVTAGQVIPVGSYTDTVVATVTF